MKLNDGIYKVMDSPVKIKILLYLLSGKPVPKMSERELSRVLKVPSAAVNRAMSQFEGINLVAKSSLGAANIWEVREKSYSYGVLKKITEDISKAGMPSDILNSMIKKAFAGKKGILSVVLFGSVARGDEKENSDIDLFVKVAGSAGRETAEKAAGKLSAQCVETFGNMVSAYILTENESREPARAKLMQEINSGIKII